MMDLTKMNLTRAIILSSAQVAYDITCPVAGKLYGFQSRINLQVTLTYKYDLDVKLMGVFLVVFAFLSNRSIPPLTT